MCTSADPGENMCKVSKKTDLKIYDAITRYPLSIHLRSVNDKIQKVQKSEKKNNARMHMHIFRLWRKHEQSFMCSRGTHCLYIEGEKRLSSQCGKK